MHDFLNTCILYYILMNMSIPKMNKNAIFINFYQSSTAIFSHSIEATSDSLMIPIKYASFIE